MIIWFSLVAAILLFGGRSDATPNHHRDMNPQATVTQSPATNAASAVAPAPTTAGSSITPTYFQTNWSLPNNISLFRNSSFSYTIAESPGEISNLGAVELVLCQTNASGATLLGASNTWTVFQVPGTCVYPVNGVCAFSIGFQPVSTSTAVQSLNNFFLCIGPAPGGALNALTCESYSPFFNVDPDGDDRFTLGNASPPATPTAPIAFPNHSDIVAILGASNASASNYATVNSVYTTVTVSPSQISETKTPTASATAFKSKGGLSTGALVGIIVGAIGAILIFALLALICLRRRKKRTRSNTVDSHGSQPDHVLLTQPYHSVSESRDLINEKNSLSPGTLESILEIPLGGPVLPQNPRHSYDSLNASAPYSGLAAAAPKRKQALSPPASQITHSHSNSLLSRELSSSTGPLSRGVSDASDPLSRGLSDASGPISPRSHGEEFEEYHDVPIYGDARHTPTVYQSHPSLQAPFLTEEVMSEEEIARLEEEERRIDAAIAEAEERR